MSDKKRKQTKFLTLAERKQVIDDSGTGVSGRKLGQKFAVDKNVIGKVLKNKDGILKEYGQNANPDRKRTFLSTQTAELDGKVYGLFVACRSKNIPVTGEEFDALECRMKLMIQFLGPLLQEKARVIAGTLNIDDFKANNGWLDRFRCRHNIQFKTLSGESAEVDYGAAEDYIKKLPEILKDYEPRDRFNADEFGLFYREIPKKSLSASRADRRGIKNSKHRITVLIAASQEGEKLPLLVIGSAKDPHCFKNNRHIVNKLNTQYSSSRKAWMNSHLFEEWIANINDKMVKKGRKIIIFVDNACSHKLARTFSNVRVEFLPPNLTSAIQPMDQGVISQVKRAYRKKMLRRLINSIEEYDKVTEAVKKIDLLDAMRWLEKAWAEVNETTIEKFLYFRIS